MRTVDWRELRKERKIGVFGGAITRKQRHAKHGVSILDQFETCMKRKGRHPECEQPRPGPRARTRESENIAKPGPHAGTTESAKRATGARSWHETRRSNL